MQWRTWIPKPNALSPASVTRQGPLKFSQKSIGIFFLAHSVLFLPIWAQSSFEYSREAELTSRGMFTLAPRMGKLIKMAGSGHCSEVVVAADKQTVGCAVMRADLSWAQLEIYLKGGVTRTIEPGGLIRDWYFWKDGQQVAVYSGPATGPGTYALYDAATARVVKTQAELSDESLLPQRAKSQAQIAMNPSR